MKYVIFALLAAVLSAEKKTDETPVIPDKERASLYYLLWQQESAQSRLAVAQMATKNACDAVPACASAMSEERKAEQELEKTRSVVTAAFKPLEKEGYDLTAQLTYRKKEAVKPNAPPAK